jgi:hypothetical protein
MSPKHSSQPLQKDNELRQQLHESARAELLERQFSNSEAYDKAILTLSSGFLALSLTFIKDLVPSNAIKGVGLLYASWIVLALAIIATVLSFRISDAAINGQLQQIDRYYHERDERALAKSKLAHYVDWFNNTSGALFVLGVFLTVVFVIFNFSEAKSMGKTLINEGQTIPTMQKLSDNLVKKGQSIPQVQKVPQPQSPPTVPAQPATPAGQTAGTTQKK